MYSDNAKQFIAADKHLTELFQNVNLTRMQEEKYGGDYQITWKFGTPYASWKYGVIKRLVAVLKRQLRVALQKELISVKALQTLLIEIKKIIK
jgi:hypothetical protein